MDKILGRAAVALTAATLSTFLTGGVATASVNSHAGSPATPARVVFEAIPSLSTGPVGGYVVNYDGIDDFVGTVGSYGGGGAAAGGTIGFGAGCLGTAIAGCIPGGVAGAGTGAAIGGAAGTIVGVGKAIYNLF